MRDNSSVNWGGKEKNEILEKRKGWKEKKEE